MKMVNIEGEIFISSEQLEPQIDPHNPPPPPPHTHTHTPSLVSVN